MRILTLPWLIRSNNWRICFDALGRQCFIPAPAFPLRLLVKPSALPACSVAAGESFNHQNRPSPAFGRVGAIVQAQLTGAGGPERNWAALKYIWDDYRINLSPLKAEKLLVIHEGHRREMQQLETDPSKAPLWKIWTSEEVSYDLGLEKFGAAVDMTAPTKAKFNCFIEE